MTTTKPAFLFEDGKKVGEISDWVRTERPAQTKTVLGKVVDLPKQNDQCAFTSPKVVGRKSTLTIRTISSELALTDVKVKAGTYVTATISGERKL